MLIRCELPGDELAIARVHAAAFRRPDSHDPPVEVALVEALRQSDDWIAALSLVAMGDDGIAGHVLCTRARLAGQNVVGLAPLAVLPEHHGRGIGSALMHAVLGAADSLDQPLVALLGEPAFYARFGFRPAAELGIESPDPAWGRYFQVRTLAAYDPALTGRFTYAPAIANL